jgi:hypothetical protein
MLTLTADHALTGVSRSMPLGSNIFIYTSLPVRYAIRIQCVSYREGCVCIFIYILYTERFLAENGLGTEQLSDVASFVRHAMR